MKKVMELPLMNVRDVVLFPEAYQQLYIGREFTIAAIQHAKKFHQRKIVAVTQKAVQKEKPLSKSDMFSIGTICTIENSVMTADGTMKVLLLGEKAVSIHEVFENEGVRFAKAFPLKSNAPKQKLSETEKREALTLLVKWHPALALDEDEERLGLLKKETNLSAFVATVSALVSYPRFEKDAEVESLKRRRIGIGSMHRASPKKLIETNQRVKRRQLLLEEMSQRKRLLLIKEMLSEEIHSGAY